MSQTHYQILGVEPTADANTIKSAHRRLAKQYHPDFNRAPTAKAMMQRINEAYAVLNDPSKRAEYDRSLIPQAEPSNLWANMPNEKRTYAQDVVERSFWQRESGVTLEEKKRDFADTWRALVPGLPIHVNYTVQMTSQHAKMKVHFAIPDINVIVDINQQETLQAFNAVTEAYRYEAMADWHIIRFSEAEMFSDPHECALITRYIVEAILSNEAENEEVTGNLELPTNRFMSSHRIVAGMIFGILGFAVGFLLGHMLFKRFFVLDINLGALLPAMLGLFIGLWSARSFSHSYAQRKLSAQTAWGVLAMSAFISCTVLLVLDGQLPAFSLLGPMLLLFASGGILALIAWKVDSK